MRVILEMQMTAAVHIHSRENGVLICPNNTVGRLLWVSWSVSTLSRRDCLVWKVDYTCSKARGENVNK